MADERDALKRTPLHLAIEQGKTAIARRLLDAGADPSAVDYRRNTPLHVAAGVGDARIVDALLALGADACAENTFRMTPLHDVAAGGGTANARDRISIATRLLDAGAVLDALDTTERTPLWYACATGTAPRPPAVMKARLALVEFLLARGADPTRKARGEQGTPLDAAHGRHQEKRYRIVWPEAVALLERAMAGR